MRTIRVTTCMNTIQGIQYICIVNAPPDNGNGAAFLNPAATAAVQAFHEELLKDAHRQETV